MTAWDETRADDSALTREGGRETSETPTPGKEPATFEGKRYWNEDTHRLEPFCSKSQLRFRPQKNS